MVRTVLLDDYQDSVQEGCELEKKYGRKKLPLKILSEVNCDSVYMAVILLVLYRVVVLGSVALSQLAIIVG